MPPPASIPHSGPRPKPALWLPRYAPVPSHRGQAGTLSHLAAPVKEEWFPPLSGSSVCPEVIEKVKGESPCSHFWVLPLQSTLGMRCSFPFSAISDGARRLGKVTRPAVEDSGQRLPRTAPLGPDLSLQSLGPSGTKTFLDSLRSSGVPARVPDQWLRTVRGQGPSHPTLPCPAL